MLIGDEVPRHGRHIQLVAAQGVEHLGQRAREIVGNAGQVGRRAPVAGIADQFQRVARVQLGDEVGAGRDKVGNGVRETGAEADGLRDMGGHQVGKKRAPVRIRRRKSHRRRVRVGGVAGDLGDIGVAGFVGRRIGLSSGVGETGLA